MRLSGLRPQMRKVLTLAVPRLDGVFLDEGGLMSETQTGTGYTHELLHFDTTERLVDEVVPWLREAPHAERPWHWRVRMRTTGALEALGDQDRIVVLPRAEIYQKAVTAVAWVPGLHAVAISTPEARGFASSAR